jgi:murein L,D-transpeptidase YcbB/YkuD
MPLSSPRFGRDPDLQSAAENKPPLKAGANGEGVKIVQRALVDLGFAMPKSTKARVLDGIFGGETEATVKSFQRDNGLPVDGVVGRDTLGLLDRTFFLIEEEQRLQSRAGAVTPFPLGNHFLT